MKMGTSPPEWAAKLVDHWISIKDADLNVFVSITDTLDDKVRFIGTTEFSVREGIEGRLGSGLFCAFLEEGEVFLLEAPEGLEKWTEDEVAANLASDNLIDMEDELCDKQE